MSNLQHDYETAMQRLKESDWYKTRPERVKKAIDILNPLNRLRIKRTGQDCMIHSYQENEDGTLTCTVTLTDSEFSYFHDSVFGLAPTDLEVTGLCEENIRHYLTT